MTMIPPPGLIAAPILSGDDLSRSFDKVVVGSDEIQRVDEVKPPVNADAQRKIVRLDNLQRIVLMNTRLYLRNQRRRAHQSCPCANDSENRGTEYPQAPAPSTGLVV